ncbi:dentin matrix acidic phosphoprotein 1-like isoform X1 [Corvus kubaryi]|uniref:dentin matrix acidic phosphoprotein 1-like isoform X1 n=2 Tax=Corvus kubaryi TaxID=68294 RepID=UPI001C0520B5|nr:dentin matrix acidic phosphoprotein 1-like isoform X1 [Corvus kubaryi]
MSAPGTTTDMRAAFLVLLLWAMACAHPVPGHEPTHSSALQEDTANEDYISKLGNHLDGGDGIHPPASPEPAENALARDLTGGNAVNEEMGELSGQDMGGRVGQAQHVNQVDHEDMGAHNGNDLGFLEADARDTDDGDNGDHYGTRANGFPSHGDRFLDEEDDSGDDTFDANGEEERGEGPTYVAGADGAGEHEHDAGRGDAGAGRGHGDSSSSSSSSSESIGADHRRYRNYGFGRTHRHGGASSSSQEEESYDFQDEAMQGDDPSVFDGPGSSYRMRHAGPRALGNSWESAQGAGSHRWEEGDSRSPEVEDGDSGEDSPSVEDNSQSEEPVDSQSEEKSSSRSREDGDVDGEDSPSREKEDSESREGTDEQSDEEPGESPEVVRTLNEHSSSWTWEGQEDWDSAEDRSVLSTPDSESREEEGEPSRYREDDDDQSQSTEDTAEESEEDENDSVPTTSAESPESPEDDSSPEDNTGEDSRSTESDNSESQEDDDDVESHSQEDATRESSSHGDDSSQQSLESGGRKQRLGALRHRPAADYDDNDCQDGY